MLLSSMFFYVACVFSTLVTAAPAATTPAFTYTGQGTWYETGLGACGRFNVDSDLVVAVGHELFDTYPGYAGANPNDNPICGREVTATYNGFVVTATIVDRCAACAEVDLDFSPGAFAQLAVLAAGHVDIEWGFV